MFRVNFFVCGRTHSLNQHLYAEFPDPLAAVAPKPRVCVSVRVIRAAAKQCVSVCVCVFLSVHF